jgi:putative acetyltransferase
MGTKLAVELREERPGDVAAIRDVHRRAFGQELEGTIVDALRRNEGAMLSLVATLENAIVGHIMFSPAFIGDVRGAALGPMAVVPEHQRQGIGALLIDTGLRSLQAAAVPFVIVVGHPEYYPRFGFQPANTYHIRCEWDVPDEVFMISILDEPRMRGVAGLAMYRPEFASAI